MNTPARLPSARYPIYWSFSGIKGIEQYMGCVMMVMKRYSFYAIRRAHPDRSFPPPLRVSSQKCAPTVGGMISWFNLPARAYVRRADGGHPCHVCHPQLLATAPKTATTGADITAALPSLHMYMLHCGPHNGHQRWTVAFDRTLLTN